jgi:hypothetical protein
VSAVDDAAIIHVLGARSQRATVFLNRLPAVLAGDEARAGEDAFFPFLAAFFLAGDEARAGEDAFFPFLAAFFLAGEDAFLAGDRVGDEAFLAGEDDFLAGDRAGEDAVFWGMVFTKSECILVLKAPDPERENCCKIF